MRRPTAVTLIGWFWRIGGILGMALAFPIAFWGRDWLGEAWFEAVGSPHPLLLFVWCFASSLLALVCGNGLLKGRNWARTLALGYCVASTLVGAVIGRQLPYYWPNLVLNVVFIAVMGLLLFSPPTTPYFRSDEPLPA